MCNLQACRAMRFFPPETRVLTRVAFTRCLYAALVRQRFTPDRRTGWSLPPFNTPEFASHELGAKLASGFEILVARAKPRPGEDSRAWQLYVDKLKSRGYFQGLLEGSKGHSQKLQEAKQYFAEHGAEAGEAVGESILALLSNMDVDVEKLKANEKSLPQPDSDSWLEITPEELDEMLKDRYGTERSNFPASSHPSQIPGQLNKFLEQMSSFEGVEFAGNGGNGSPPVRPKRGVKKGKNKTTSMDISDNEQTDSPSRAPKVDFNPDAFACAVQNILDFALPDDNWDLESGSDMSSIGEEHDDEMDETKVGKVDEKIKKYMAQMDAELAKTTIGESFEKSKPEVHEDSFDDIEDFRPVDIDLNALKNVLASYQSELGVGPGPASSLLGPMGVHLETMPSKDSKDSNYTAMVDNKLNTGSKRKNHLVEEKKEKTEKIVAKASVNKEAEGQGPPPAKKPKGTKKPKNPAAAVGASEDDKNSGAKVEGKVAKRRKANKKSVPKERVQNNTKSEERQKELQLKAHEYLETWKNDKKSWKFSKNIQTWLIVNIFDTEKLPSEKFDIALEYLKGAHGSVRKDITKFSIAKAHDIRTNTKPNPEDAEANQEILVRSRRVIKLMASEEQAEKENADKKSSKPALTESANPPKVIKEEANKSENETVKKEAAEKVVSFVDEENAPVGNKKAKKALKATGNAGKALKGKIAQKSKGATIASKGKKALKK
ncbi:Hypothetical predicted protein [Cloeon dipterum]|uniref:WKF domain-containing protein n=1 Tax=Cloeon dipterum TaxID=197152 RepID=A0A8S1C503_9INSE|nr:Hypothetical predicted protein [Cloeon dipterum]